MIFDKTPEPHNRFADSAIASVDGAVHAGQSATNDALDALSGSVQDLRGKAATMLNHGGDEILALTRRGMDAVRDGSQQVRDKALHASDVTLGYIRKEPVKAVLIAAATGAALMGLIALLTRSRDHS